MKIFFFLVSYNSTLFCSAQPAKIERTVEQTKNGPVVTYRNTISDITAHCWTNFDQYEVINPLFINSNGSHKRFISQDKSKKIFETMKNRYNQQQKAIKSSAKK